MSARSTEADLGRTGAASPRPADAEPLLALALVAPALATVTLFFLYPLGWSLVSAFADREGAWSLANFAKVWELYGTDILFTVATVGLATVITGVLAVAIGGYLTLGTSPAAVAVLRWLYRWPLFVPMIVAGQVMRSFLAKNGLLNHALIGAGLLEPLRAQSFLDWRGLVATYVWKQAPFVALMVAGAMASLDRGMVEAARNLGAGRVRVLLGIVLPQVRQTLAVGLVLSFVTMMSVLSVPVMLVGGSPTVVTVDMAFRITAYGDYGVANALGFVSYLLTGLAAWVYLRQGVRRDAAA
jgi:putative spermidine/putrescine transport system permease protein